MLWLARRVADRVSFRLGMLSLICVAGVGGYLAYDSIGVVERALLRDVPLSPAQFGALYTAYTVAGVAVPTVAGRWIDRHGVRSSTVLALTLSLLGATMTAVGATRRSFAMLLVARFLFGAGSEAVFVARNNACLEYFSDALTARHVGLALAMTVASGRLGSFLTFACSDAVVQRAGGWYVAALWFGAAACLVSLLCGAAFVALDWATERSLGYAVRRKPSVPPASVSAVSDADDGLLTSAADDAAATALPAPAAAVLPSLVARCPRPVRALYSAAARSSVWRDTAALDRSFWYALAVVMLYYGVVFPMQSTATALLEARADVSKDEVWQLTSSIALVSMLASPLLGAVVDRWGQAVHLCTAGFVLLLVALALLYWGAAPWPAFLLFGVAFSVEPAALWPCVPMLVPPAQSGFAFGVLSTGINVALSLAYPLLAWLSGGGGAHNDLLAGMILSAFGALLCVAWHLREQRFENRCNRPPRQVTLS